MSSSEMQDSSNNEENNTNVKPQDKIKRNLNEMSQIQKIVQMNILDLNALLNPDEHLSDSFDIS